jgi:hypothetical protein
MPGTDVRTQVAAVEQAVGSDGDTQDLAAAG